MPSQIVETFNVLGAAASVGSFVLQTQQQLNGPFSVTQLAQWLLEGRFTAKPPELTKTQARQAASIGKHLIDEQLLDTLKEKIQECRAKHIAELKDSQTSDQRDAIHRRAKQCVCDILREIVTFNGGRLPKVLQKMWESYGCVS